ncbi:MAG TPA: sensor histidine kinase [Bryobacteraceae bacterium]|nr:sensor histidine kinase [Bryobacteraceae bacterium]
MGVFSFYALRQIGMLNELQASTIDRNRKDTLQLLRIQNSLHSIGLAFRDMLDGEEPYGIDAWHGQFKRIRADLLDALELEAQFAPIARNPGRQQYVASAMAQFFTSVDQLFATAAVDQGQARTLIRTSLQAQQAALTNTVARMLVENNEVEQEAFERIQGIYDRVERQIYYFLGAALLTISLTTLYLIRSNRRIFERLAALSADRSELARRLISGQEEVLQSISRELHDEFGQVLTAIGAMLRRAEKHLPPESPFHEDVREIRQVAQGTIEKVRSLSQSLHPSILDDRGLEEAVDWYIPVFERQTGIQVRYEKTGACPAIPERVAINVYRVLQEALSNLARHSESPVAWVRVKYSPDRVRLEVEDHGIGIAEGGASGARRGTGIVAMRERAALLGGSIELARSTGKGTVVRLDVPLAEAAAHEE